MLLFFFLGRLQCRCRCSPGAGAAAGITSCQNPTSHHGCPGATRRAAVPKWPCGQRHQPAVQIHPVLISTLWRPETFKLQWEYFTSRRQHPLWASGVHWDRLSAPEQTLRNLRGQWIQESKACRWCWCTRWDNLLHGASDPGSISAGRVRDGLCRDAAWCGSGEEREEKQKMKWFSCNFLSFQARDEELKQVQREDRGKVGPGSAVLRSVRGETWEIKKK